jgi:zinc protease
VVPEVQDQLIDGVRVLHADSPSGQCAAILMFRVGRFDETLPTSGITHLVEHLTFSTPERPTYQFNAEVSGRFTTFFMESSESADLADFVATVCRGLAAHHSGRLEQEKRVLRTEATSRGGAGALGSCLVERFGATGPGLVGYDELGLRKLRWEQAASWRSRWFVAENAVLCVLGEVPGDLHIDLPHGQVPEVPALCPRGLQLPGFIVASRGGIGMSLIGDRSIATAVALDVLQNRLTNDLRHDRGLTYSVQAGSEYLDSRLRHSWLAADALPEQAALAAHVMLGTFERLAGEGCTPAELADYSRRLHDAYQSPAGPLLIMRRHAEQILFQKPPRKPSDTLRLIGEVTSRDVAAAARHLNEGMIVATPQLIPAVQGRMAQLPMWSETAVKDGVSYPSPDSAATLTIGDGGAMLTAGPGRFAAVHSDQVAALLKWSDAKLTLIGTDGFTLQLDPAEWTGAEHAFQVLENRTDPDLIVSIDAPGPASRKLAPQDPPRADAAGGATPLRPRRKVKFTRLLLLWFLAAAWIAALAVAFMQKSIDLDFVAIIIIVVMGARILWILVRRHKRTN